MYAHAGRPSAPLCSGPTRREFLRVGGLTVGGLSLPTLLAAATPAGKRRAKSCILVFMEGGPSHLELWDLKPNAPAEIRGEFGPVRTSVPGLTVGELLPQLAGQMHHVAQVRSVHHGITDHNAGSYYMLTGRSPSEGGGLVVADGPTNFPPFGAVAAKLRPVDRPVPPFVHLPEFQWNNGADIPGQSAGFLGARFDPFVAGDPSVKDYRVPGLDLLPEVPLDRLGARDDLRQQLDRAVGRLGQADALNRAGEFQRQAMALVTSPAARAAFDLSQEPAAVRERYGLDPGTDRGLEARKFGGLPHLGQCLLLARRLVEAGTRLVTVVTGRRIDQAWDTHRDHFGLMRKSLCPPFDRGVSALIADLHERGMLGETLVVLMGEFGRTPKVGQVTSNAGANKKDGRDHWPFCYTVLFAGGGVPGGAVVGASDRHAAYPLDTPVTPEDIAATVYTLLGIDPATEVRDAQDRPYVLTPGRPVAKLVG